jgi:hypothetical protein
MIQRDNKSAWRLLAWQDEKMELDIPLFPLLIHSL